MQTDVLIAGAGVTGLAVAMAMQQEGREYVLAEARDRVGGRVKSAAAGGAAGAAPRYDLGPAWFWPGQPRIEALANAFGLPVFEQYAEGKLVFQDANGAIRRDLTLSTMAGALRLGNGMASITDAMAATLLPGRVRLSSPVERVTRTALGLDVALGGAQETIRCRHIVIALPPRVAAQSILFEPPLSSAQGKALQAIPAWMAGQAKVVAVYGRPYWRAAGLSGDGISRRGPLTEIHDASPANAQQGALFGFAGVPARIRARPDFDLAAAAVTQLTAMFGADASQPLDVMVEDWARDPLTATPADAEASGSHSPYHLPAALREVWSGRVQFASTEMAPAFGGFVEGALEAAEAACRNLKD